MNNVPKIEARYVLPQYEERTPYGHKMQNPYTKLFEDRIVFLGTQVDEISANDIMSQLLVLASIDAERDITMYINSPGGSVTDMTAIIDTMEFIAPDVSTVCLGQASSAAAVILAAGAKGKRLALPRSRVMIHQPSHGGTRGQASDITITAEEIKRLRDSIETDMAHFTGQDKETINKDMRRDKFLSASEALDYGIIDAIVEPAAKRK